MLFSFIVNSPNKSIERACVPFVACMRLKVHIRWKVVDVGCKAREESRFTDPVASADRASFSMTALHVLRLSGPAN